MADAKSILSIDVDDSKFKVFQAAFEKYQTALGKLPGSWAKTDAAVSATEGSIAGMTAALLAQQDLIHKASLDHEKTAKALTTSSRAMNTMKRDSMDLWSNIKGIASTFEKVLKWGSILGGAVLGGTALSLFGIKDFAGGIASQGLRARSLGISTGELNAWDIDYGTVMADPEGFLSNIVEAEGDTTNSAGVHGDILRMKQAGMDPAQIGAKLLPEMVDLFNKTGQSKVGMQNWNMQDLLPYEQLRALSVLPKEQQLPGVQSQYLQDVPKLTMTPDQIAQWTEFNRQLGFLTANLKNLVAVDLTPIIIQLDAFIKAILGLPQSPTDKPSVTDPNIPVLGDSAVVKAAKSTRLLLRAINGENTPREDREFIDKISGGHPENIGSAWTGAGSKLRNIFSRVGSMDSADSADNSTTAASAFDISATAAAKSLAASLKRELAKIANEVNSLPIFQMNPGYEQHKKSSLNITVKVLGSSVPASVNTVRGGP